MKITDPDVIKTGEKDLIDAVKEDLDLDVIRQLLEKKIAAQTLASKGGEIIVHENQIAFRLDFELNLSGSLMFDREGNHIPEDGDTALTEPNAVNQAEDDLIDSDLDDEDLTQTTELLDIPEEHEPENSELEKDGLEDNTLENSALNSSDTENNDSVDHAVDDNLEAQTPATDDNMDSLIDQSLDELDDQELDDEFDLEDETTSLEDIAQDLDDEEEIEPDDSTSDMLEPFEDEPDIGEEDDIIEDDLVDGEINDLLSES